VTPEEPRITLQDAATWWIQCHDSVKFVQTAYLQAAEFSVLEFLI